MLEQAWQLYTTGKHKMGRYISTGSAQASVCSTIINSTCYQTTGQKYAFDSNSCWQNRVILDTPGSYTFTVPSGVTCIRTIAVGGGGKASFSQCACCNFGGAGGGYVERTDTIASGCTVTIVVGRQQQDTTIAYTATGGARTLTAGGATCCNPGTATGGDWNSIGGAAGKGESGGYYCGVGNCFTATTCCGYCVVYSGYGITYSPDNSPGYCSGKAPGGGSAGSWIWPCGGMGGGARNETQVVGDGYGPVAGGGGGIGYICKKGIEASTCSCICSNSKCADGFPGGRKNQYPSSADGGGGTKLQRCDTAFTNQVGFRGMCVAGQYFSGPGGWGGYDNEEGRDSRFFWFHKACFGATSYWQEHGPEPKRYQWHDIHSMCGSGSPGTTHQDGACYRSCSSWLVGGSKLALQAAQNSGEGAGTGGVAYFCCELSSIRIPYCMGGADYTSGINWALLCCLGTSNRICCADKMQDQLFPYITHCAGTLGGAGGVDIERMASRAGKGGGAGMVRCYLHCVCWGGSFNLCNGSGPALAFPPCDLDWRASTAGTGMAIIYWRNP